MQSIRTRLLASFFVIIAILLALSVVFVFLHFALIKQYKDITTNMINEYHITEVSTQLISSFASLTKSIDDDSLQNQYNSLHTEIQTLFSKLDSTIVNKSSRVAYLGLKNTVDTLIREVDGGIAEVKKGNISVVGEAYNKALRQSYFVTQNVGTLILNELRYAEQIQTTIAQNEFWSEVFGVILFILISIIATIYSILFSRHLVAPLSKLTNLAKSITNGNSNLSVNKELLDEKGEVGILARSFNAMIHSLSSTIQALDAEKKGVEKKIIERTHELQEEQARLLASIQSLSLGFILVDARENILTKNSSAQTILDLSTEQYTMEMVAESLKNVFDVKAKVQECIKEKKVIETKNIQVASKFIRILLAPVITQEDSGSEVIGYVFLIEDTTSENLLDQAKSAFVAITAHELRTPLTVIRGNAELLMGMSDQKLSDDTPQKMLAALLRSSVRLLGIVNDFLDLTALEGKRIIFRKEPINILELIQEVVAEVKEKATHKGLSITIAKPSTLLPVVSVDKNRAKEVILNIVGNSIQYTEKGGTTIMSSVDGAFVKIEVSDTGIGIKPEFKSLLFQKFQTVGGFIHSTEYGSGLGLYISRLLIEGMGGHIRLEKSSPGEGSIFGIYFPIVEKNGNG